MKLAKSLVLGAALLASASLTSIAAMAKDITVGVSWSNFQEERWKTDEAAIKAVLDKAGAKYISADAQDSPSKQLTDVESLISKGANVLAHPREGFGSHSAGGQEGQGRRHPGHRL